MSKRTVYCWVRKTALHRERDTHHPEQQTNAGHPPLRRPECLPQVYSSPISYQAALLPSSSPSLADENEEREFLSPPTPPPAPAQQKLQQQPAPTDRARGRRPSARAITVRPPRSPSGGPTCAAASATVANAVVGGGGPIHNYANPLSLSDPAFGGGGGNGAAGLTSNPSVDMSAAAVGTGGRSGGGGGTRAGGGGSAPASPRGGGLPKLLRQGVLQVRGCCG